MSNIRVAVRVRPLSDREREKGSREIIEVHKNTISIENVKVLGIQDYGDSRSKFKSFSFDHIYNCLSTGPDYATQKQVFEDLGTQVLTSALDGFNACVFAYGQTGTGKTHTMMGYQGLFRSISECADEKLTCRVDVSYFEIYKEKVHDLLQPELAKQGGEKVSLRVREHPKDGPYVHGLSWHRVREYVDVQDLLDRGVAQRVTAETYIHDRSSRSHAIVTISFTQARLEENRPSEIVSKMHLVDLAGSEKADPSSRPDFRKRLTEGSSINRSLVALGNVIKALAEKSLLSWSTDDMGSTHSFSGSGGGESPAGQGSPGSSGKQQRAPFIPYRDSPLTYLLKDSLGGNSKTIMIATITPASHFYSETLSTLRYAQRAKNIINKPRINEDTNVALIRELRKEIERLREMLANAQKPTSPCEDIMYFVPSFGRHTPSDQGGDFVNLQDSEDTIIAEKLHENEEMAKQLTQSWMGKWSSSHDIMKETDLSIRNLRNRHSSMGVMIDSQLPYLVGMDDDVLSTGVVIFHLKEGDTTVGREDAEVHQDIVLMGPYIQQEHCVIHHGNGEVRVHPLPGAMCSIQGIECTEPTRLTQGDYVAFGGDQVFRFNNPAEAAKLRENRRSQGSLNTFNTSYMSFGGLSRASSYSSLGTDDSNYLSPNSLLGRSYPNRRRHSDIVMIVADTLVYGTPYANRVDPDETAPTGAVSSGSTLFANMSNHVTMSHELERKHQSEHERIAEARRKLDQLHEEHERAEESRLEKEEEMYARHEQHRADIEEQKRHLARLVQENERARQKAEEELQLARESLNKEKEAFQKELDEQRKKLKQLHSSMQNTESSGIQTDPLSLKTSSTDTLDSSVAMETEPDDDSSDKSDQPAKKVRRVSVDDQLRELEATEFSRRMSYRETEESLSIQQEDMEEQYEATREKIEAKMAKIRQIEEEYRDMDKEYLEQMSKQTAVVDALHKEEVQLEVYIQENEELMSVSRDVPRPLRGACSEMFLTDPALNTTTFPQKTSSLRDVHQRHDVAESGKKSPSHIENAPGNENQLNTPQINVLSASADSVKSESTTMSTSGSRPPKTEGSKAKKDKKDPLAITNVAKDVTSRLYRPPEPKFKYVPKPKEEALPPITRPARVRATDAKSRSSPSKFFQEHSPSPQRSEHSPSPLRRGGKRTSPSPSRDLDPKRGDSPVPPKPFLKKGTGKPLETKATGKVMPVRNRSDKNKKDSTITRAVSPQSTKGGRESPDSASLSPGSSTSRSRTPPVKLRHIASASSLASVPESLSEESEAQKQTEQEPVSYVVKRRARKGRSNQFDDEFRTHSAPDSQNMEKALDEYTLQMLGGLSPEKNDSDRVVPVFNTSYSVDDSDLQRGDGVDSKEQTEEKAGDPSIVLGKRDHSDGPADSLKSPPVSPRKRSKSEGADSDSDWCDDDNTRTCVQMDTQVAPKERSFSDDSLNASDVSEDSLESGDKKRLTQSLPAYLMHDEKPISDDSLNDSLEDKKDTAKEENVEDGQLDANDDQFVNDLKNKTVNPEPKKLSSLEEKLEKAKSFTITEMEYCDVATLGPEPKSKPNLSMVVLPPIDICDGSPINAETMTEPGTNCEDLQVQTVDTDITNKIVEPTAKKSAPAPQLTVVNLPNVFFISSGDNSSSDDEKAKVEQNSEEDVLVNTDKVKQYVEEIVDGAKEKIIEETQYRPDSVSEVSETLSSDDKQTHSVNNSNTDAINVELSVGELEGKTETESCSEANANATRTDTVGDKIEASKNTSGTNNSDELGITNNDPTQEDEFRTKDNEQGENMDFTFKPIKASEREQMELDMANNADPEVTAPKGAVFSGSALFESEKDEPDQQNCTEIEQQKDEPDQQNCTELEQQQQEFIDVTVDESTNSVNNHDDALKAKSSTSNENLPGDMETQQHQTQTGKDQDTLAVAVVTTENNAVNTKSDATNQNLQRDTETPTHTLKDKDAADDAPAKDTTDETGMPLTRSIGVGTSLECLAMEDGEAMMLGSDDSLVDPETELQVLQDALDQLPARPSATGPQLSTARRAARQRAMIRQQQRQQRTGDSDGVEPGSDESPASGNRSKSSSRPGSGSRRRKRPQSKVSDKSKQRTDHTSDDYDSSENDSVYSEGSVEDTLFPSEAGKCQNGRKKDANGGQDIVITTDSLESSETEEMSQLFKNKLRKSSTRNRQRLESTEVEDGPDGKRNVGIQTPVYGRFNTRPDLSDFDGSFTSGDINRGMTVSPISVWASDKPKHGKKSARNSSSSSGVVRPVNESQSATPRSTPRSSTRSTSSLFLEHSNLEQGVTEVWSSSTSDLKPEHKFNDDLSYAVETESIIPLASSLDYSEDGLPSGSFMESRSDAARPGCSTPKNSGRAVSISYPESQVEKAATLDYATPVKFEVTVHEETPNIIYNVEKTEYKTYALRNGDSEKPQVIPDTIHVNMTENLSSQTEEKFVSHTTENVRFERQDQADNSDGEVFESETAARLKYSSEREIETKNGQIKNETTKEDKEMVEDHTQYKVPSDSKQDKSGKVKKVQLRNSGLVETTSYPGDRSESPQTDLKVSSELNNMDESDYTSDYGTFISFDGRRCSDSGEDSISPRISPRPPQGVEENVTKSRNGPALQAAFAPIVPLEKSLDNVEQLEDSHSTQPSQQICSTEDVVTPLVIAARTEQSSPVQFILNTALEASTTSASTTDTESGSCNTVRPQQETLEDLDADIPDPSTAGTQTENQHLQSPRCDKSVSSADEMFISLEQIESNSSSCSSEYKTPKQSPRDIDNNETSEQVANVVIPDLDGDASFTTTPRVENEMSANQGPMLTSSPKVPPSVKNASVNTEMNTAASKISPRSAREREVFGGPHDPIRTEATRREVEEKIARLNHKVRSLSDSAISSDYTDCDSSSPRGNRVGDSDRNSNGKKLSKTKTKQSGAAADISTDPRRTLNFESEGVKKSPFKDSGSILDEGTSEEEGNETDTKPSEVTDFKGTNELALRRSKAIFQFEPAVRSIGKFPETVIGAVLAIKPYPLQRSASLDSIATLVNAGTSLSRAVRESQSIEDLHAMADSDNKGIPTDSKKTIHSNNINEVDENENLLSSGGLGSQFGDRPLSPGEIGIGQGSIDDMVEAVENENIKPDTSLPVAAANSKIVSEKATSMSFLDERPVPEYHRSLSEGNIDDLDGSNDTSCTSNDSITFVFVGQEYAKNNASNYKEDESGANNASKHANISGRGPLEISSSDSENVSVVLSRSASFESVLMEDKTEDQVSTHSASEEIEEIIKATSQPSNLHSQRVFDDKSPPTYTDTSDDPVPNRNYHYEDDDSAPLRHRFGIDESVLPIPERSVSADNIPKHVLTLKDMNRSRSTSMLDMAAAEAEESESGIFPPALSYVDEDQTDPSMSLRTMSEGALEQFSQRSLSERGANNSDQTSSEMQSSEMEDFSSAGIQSVCSNSSSMGELVEEYTINYTTNDPKYKHVVISSTEEDVDKHVKEEEDHIREVLRTVERFFMPTIGSADKGTSTDPEDVTVTDVPEDNSPTLDSGTQTSANMQTMIQPNQIRLPALASSFRAQSVDSFGLGRHSEDIELSEGAENWCTLGELMTETTQLLRKINEKLPDLDRRESVSSAESQAILKQWQNISIQTGSSLSDLQTVGLQTDELTEKSTNETSRATQVEPEFRLNQLEISEICTEEILELPISTNENTGQFDDSVLDIPVVEESLTTSQQSEQFTALPVTNKAATSSSAPVDNVADRGIDTYNKPENKNSTSQQPKGKTAKFIPQVKAELGLDKEGQQKEPDCELPEISPRSHRPALTLPNTPEMEELRKEHNKLMENLRKASDNRKARKDAVKSRKHVPQELDLSNKNNSAPNSLDNSIDSEMQQVAPDMSDSSDINDPNARSSVSSSLASPQEFVKINIQMNPEEGVTIENTVFKERKRGRKEPKDDKQPDETETHSWQLLRDDPQKSAPIKGRSRASSGSSVSSSDTCVSAEVASVMATPPNRSKIVTDERDGALNPVDLDDETETEDVDEAGSSISNNESITEDDIAPQSHLLKESAPTLKKKPEHANLDKDSRDPTERGPENKSRFIKCETSPKLKSTTKYPPTCQSPELFESDKPVNYSNQPSYTPGQEKVPNIHKSLREDLLPRKTPKKNILSNEDLIIPETRKRDHALPNFSNKEKEPKVSQKQTTSSDDESVIEDLVEPVTHNRNHSMPCQQIHPDSLHTDDGIQASVAISDDSTQTDPDTSLESIIYPTIVTSEYMNPMFKSPTQKQPAENKTPERLKNELEKLHGQRQHMMEMLGMSHMPPSLTVELLEAKLNYCIGQTDLLLDSLEDNVRDPENSSSDSPERQKAIDFIEKYRADLKKSKEDIDECRERLNNRKEVGIGRGRTPFRRSDKQHQAQLDAFRLERMREQQDYDRTKRAPHRGSTPYQGNTPLRGNTPMMGNSPVVTPRSERSRSSSPTYSPGYMTPREHKAHLVDLRRQLISDVMEEETRHSSEPPPPLHSTPPRRNVRPRDGSLGFSPKTSVSSYEPPHRSPPTYNRYAAPPERSPSSSPHRLPFNRYTSPGESRYPDTFDTKTTAESIFSPQETAAILQEIEDNKKRLPGMSTPMEEMLRRSSFSSSGSQRSDSSPRRDPFLSPRSHSDSRPSRKSTSPNARQPDYSQPLSLNLDGLNDDEQPYSPYSAYARERVLPRERSPVGAGGVMRGTFELYHSRSNSQSDSSSVLSFGSDLDTSNQRPRLNSLDEDTVKRLRPVCAEDIKARLGRHKR